ncbi:MAG: hypothetical protein QOI10_2179 [Solirubrobacterales bacterium]|jgi:hypothetical protein|nr:hypothetical protein [Solirubrobacterales bacterium]
MVTEVAKAVAQEQRNMKNLGGMNERDALALLLADAAGEIDRLVQEEEPLPVAALRDQLAWLGKLVDAHEQVEAS